MVHIIINQETAKIFTLFPCEVNDNFFRGKLNRKKRGRCNFST